MVAASILWAHRVYEEINARKLNGHWPGPHSRFFVSAVSNTLCLRVRKSIVPFFFFFRQWFASSNRLINDPGVNYTPGNWLSNFPRRCFEPNLPSNYVTNRSIISRKWINRCTAFLFSKKNFDLQNDSKNSIFLMRLIFFTFIYKNSNIFDSINKQT